MEYLIPPWRHQREAIDRARSLPGFALFFEMGAGKTSTTINILRGKYMDSQRVLRTLILCPPIVIRNWKDEWAKHSRLDPSKVVLLTGSGRDRVKKLEAANKAHPHGFIAVTNYESMLMPDLFMALQHWGGSGPEAMVLDESHKIKDIKAKRTKAVLKLGQGAKFKYILSGSPILNSPMDIFSQFLFLDGGASFGGNFFAFRARYFIDLNADMPRHKYFPDWRVKPGALDDINAKIFAKGMRVTKAECMDLPPLVQQTIKVEMTDQQRKLYESMKQNLIAFLDSEEGQKPTSATMALTKALRLQQIASGYVKLVDGEEVALEGTPKMDALKELLTELTPHSKVIVWAVWKQNYQQIKDVCEALGVGYVEVHGDVPTSQKFKNVDAFNSDPNIRVFIGHPGSGGIGINLVIAPYAIFYSRNFSLEQSLQAEARNHRGGSEIHGKITRIDLVCQGTIDEIVQKKLAAKIEIGEKVLRDLSLELRN